MMFGNYTGKRKGQEALFSLVAVVFVMSVALLFAAPLANAASAQSRTSTVTGEIVAIDQTNNVNTLTLRSTQQIGQFPNDELNIFLNSGTKINVCKSSEPFKDMKVGRHAKVIYHELGGVPVANSVSEQC